MSFYRTCPYCGANLDPGEHCDCQDNKKTALSAANAEDGKTEKALEGSVSAFIVR